MNKIAQRVYELAKPVAQRQGLEIWDVEYLREAGQWFLRVYIDKEDGVGIDDCEKFSRELDPILDEADPISESYVFEVSSAGAERELKRPSDFEWFIGSKVEVKLYRNTDGRKDYIGTLVSYADGAVTINSAGSMLSFEKDNVAQVRLRII